MEKFLTDIFAMFSENWGMAFCLIGAVIAGATQTSIATAIKAAIEPGITKTFAQSTPLLNLLNVQPHTGGDSINWQLQYGANTAGGDHDEGDAIPAAGKASYAQATTSFQLIGVPVTVTGHAIDKARNGYFDPINNEMQDGIKQLALLTEAKVLTWLLAAVDDDATYAGLTRSTVHMDSVVEDADSGTLSLAQMKSITQQLRARPREVVMNPSEHMILTNPTLCDEYKDNLVAGYDASHPIVRNAGDSSLDASMLQKTAYYAGIPWYEVNSLAETYLLLINRMHVMLRTIRSVTVESLGKTSDNTDWWMTIHIGMGYKDPYRAAKIENIVL
jgi:hypothetical protein